MKTISLFIFLILSSQAFGAIGCIPGECGNGNPRPTPTPRPTPGCGRPTNITERLLEGSKKFVDSCNECSSGELCSELSNNFGEIVARECVLQ